MLQPSSHRWSTRIIRHPKTVLFAWILLAFVVRSTSPSWNDVAYDGDFEYLPADRTSVAGGRLLDDAFPGERSRSQLVFISARDGEKLSKQDEIVGLDLLRRLYHRLAEASWQRAIGYGYVDGAIDPTADYAPWAALAKAALDESIQTDETFYKRIEDVVPETLPTATEPRMAIAYWDRASVLRKLGESDDQVADDMEAAVVLYPDIGNRVVPIEDRDLTGWENLIDVLSWNDSLIGGKLSTPDARLAIGQLSTELAATQNIATFEAAQDLIDETLRYSRRFVRPGVTLNLTGSGAIGGETLTASRDAIRYTEWFTVVMILIILSLVYRSPLLVAIPMISIGIAVVVATGVVTHLTSWSAQGWLGGLDLRIFTTSRIFVVVILFGAGTDYCLFLIARLREEAGSHPWGRACEETMRNVSGALLGSALTTIIGLAMLWFADFGKFQSTGPVIAICLLIGLLVCLTLTPALLSLIGPRVFWPADPTKLRGQSLSLWGRSPSQPGVNSRTWATIALLMTRFPVLTLVAGIALLIPPAIHGYRSESRVTYDLSGQLDSRGVTPVGMNVLRQHFEIGEINPVTLMMVLPDDASRQELEQHVKSLKEDLYELDGIVAVRTADDPLGDRKEGLLSRDALLRRALRNHRIAQRHFFSDTPRYAQRLVRLDLVLEGNPFEEDTAKRLGTLASFLNARSSDPDSAWHESASYLTGTTPSIVDLREVTLADNRKIKVAVVLSVLAVLYLVIRRFGLCLYLIGTVLLSYYATLGLSVVFFGAVYGDEFLGLDWKLPLFLFVILVAVGQDYNVYLVTRILEEQRQLGWLAAVRRAVARTGGIITACGLVMAATFFSMTASAWFPPLARSVGLDVGTPTTLQGIVQLGFALGLGVLIDTFYVRTILVPSFFAVLGRRA